MATLQDQPVTEIHAKMVGHASSLAVHFSVIVRLAFRVPDARLELVRSTNTRPLDP